MLSLSIFIKGILVFPFFSMEPVFFSLQTRLFKIELTFLCMLSHPHFACQDAALAHLGSLLNSGLVIWTDESVQRRCFHQLLTFATKVALFYSADLDCSSLSGEVCTIALAFLRPQLHQQVFTSSFIFLCYILDPSFL